MRALLVEDEALVAMIVEEALTALGFDPVCAYSGKEALAAYAEARPVLAIVDVGLPDMRGDDLARRLRERDPELPIILASGYDAVEMKSRFKNDDKLVCLAKPYTQDDLAKALREAGALADA